MTEPYKLKGKEREAGLKALNTLHRLLQASPKLVAAKVRDEVQALVDLLDANPAGELVVDGASDEQKIQKLISPYSSESRLIRQLADKMELDISLLTELLYDLNDAECDSKGMKRGGRERIEESDLEGEDLTKDLLRIELDLKNSSQGDFSEWIRENIISKGIDQAFIKIDWDEFRDSPHKNKIPWLLERRTQFPIPGIKITPVIVCSASDLFHEILHMQGASGILASGVKWIRKRKS